MFLDIAHDKVVLFAFHKILNVHVKLLLILIKLFNFQVCVKIQFIYKSRSIAVS
ncbi:hypothetical protein HOG21_05000 [bacterium]|nr:hypothetical protein [bacterium]